MLLPNQQIVTRTLPQLSTTMNREQSLALRWAATPALLQDKERCGGLVIDHVLVAAMLL